MLPNEVIILYALISFLMSQKLHEQIDRMELDAHLARQVEGWTLSHQPGTIPPDRLARLLAVLLDHIATSEPLHFTTQFSLMAYICHKFRTPFATQQAMHLFRKKMTQLEGSSTPDKEAIIEARAWGYRALAGTIRDIFQVPLHPDFAHLLEQLPAVGIEARKTHGFEVLVELVVVGIKREQWQLIGYREDTPGQQVVVQGNVLDRNENFNALFTYLDQDPVPPIRVNLVDCEVDEHGTLFPKGIILEPDHLVDVTAIAECFTPQGEYPVIGVMKRFLQNVVSGPILAGHVANFFLDKLIQDPDLSFEDVSPAIFQLHPMGFALLSDQEVRDLSAKGKRHFLTLKQVIQTGLINEKINVEDCFLEPSFYSPEYGLQGRLDIFHLPENTTEPPGIIELKSGRPFRPNAYGLNANHYIQTLLYDILVKDVRPRIQSLTYILYSSDHERPLRYAPVVRSKQMDALQVRNKMLIMEAALSALDGNDPKSWAPLTEWRATTQPGLLGFHQRDLNLFSQAWDGLDTPEKAYFASFAGFLAREYQLAKTGRMGSERWKGQASLWLDSHREKSDRFALLSHLRIIQDDSATDDPILHLQFTPQTPSLANFRVGDISVLYPHHAEGKTTQDQLWKCTLVELHPDGVSVRLRAPQIHKSRFQQDALWHLESDFLDSSFHQLTRSLFAFASADADKRALLLGRRAPAKANNESYTLSEAMTGEQRQVVSSLLNSREYFLLWGPPGTGKTSVVLHHLVSWLVTNTTENILLLAYTNRAVDEICASVEAISPEFRNKYLRIGSRFSTSPDYRDRLLSMQLPGCGNRQEVKDLINQHRLFIGTVSSIHGQAELFELKSFDRVIIDEASQLLEPMLVGLLPKFAHFTLIGDHKQLPAVVTQDEQNRKINAATLQELSIHDAGTSLFERLMVRTQTSGWVGVTGMLSRQGRMHRDLMAFPNTQFYEGKLDLISPLQELTLDDPEIAHPLHSVLANQRVIFIPVEPEPEELLMKMNRREAEMLVDMVHYYQGLYRESGRPWTVETLGIITPFKAQIALIKQLFTEAGIPADACTIDTVERYQGGARDIILISLCVQRPQELALITSDAHGIDRKLNVALTRARERVITLGFPEALAGHKSYQAYMDAYGSR